MLDKGNNTLTQPLMKTNDRWFYNKHHGSSYRRRPSIKARKPQDYSDQELIAALNLDQTNTPLRNELLKRLSKTSN